MRIFIDIDRLKEAGRLAAPRHSYDTNKVTVHNGNPIDMYFHDDGRPYIYLKAVPAEFQEYIVSCSEQESWPFAARRVTGVYELGSASGVLKLFVRSGSMDMGGYEKAEYTLNVEGSCEKDCRDLVRAVRNGSILPIESWEEEQVRPGPVYWWNKLVSGLRRRGNPPPTPSDE